MSTVTMIPVTQVRLLNPRARSKTKFSDMVSNIAAVGLKKPITVAPREEEPGTYDLVCGQGRLEALQMLEQSEVPAFVRTVPKHDRYIMSLVENLGRARVTSMDLVRELVRLRERGHTHAESAALVGISAGYVSMLLRLMDNGEERLLRAAERGEIPIAVAVEIATSDDAAIQTSLADAYTSKQLRGKSLLAARRLVEERRSRGKAMRVTGASGAPRPKSKLVRTFKKETQRQKLLAKKARFLELSLDFVASAMKRLLADENFVNLLRAEKLESMPDYLNEKMKRAS